MPPKGLFTNRDSYKIINVGFGITENGNYCYICEGKKLLKFIMSLRMLKKWGLEWLNLVDMVVSAVLV